MKTMKIVSTELRKILAYRSDFWINFIGQMLIQLFIARALWTAVFEANGVQEMKGMTLSNLTLYYLLAPLTMKVLLGENIGFIAREIYDGGLNRFLVWPISALGFKATTYMTYSLFFLTQMILLYLIGRFYLDPTPFIVDEVYRLAVAVVFIITGSFVYFCLMCLCEMVAFWADNTWTLGVMLRFVISFLGGAFLPLNFFPETVQSILNLLPFSSMVSAPVNIILGKMSYSDAVIAYLILLLWLPLIFWASRVLWRKGCLQYTGVGM
jgi:ABC-2 type transport system permease protein